MARNKLLREQLETYGAFEGEPEGCGVDWEQNYQSIAACNAALAAQLDTLGGRAAAAAAAAERTVEGEERRVSDARAPVFFTVRLADGSAESIELQPFFRRGSFYAVRGGLPLGLQLRKRQSGLLMGAFEVEDVLDGGSAAASGEILPGDVLHGLTVVVDGADLGMRTEDFVSSVVGGFGRFRQSLVDASFIDTNEDLVEAFKTNLMLGTGTQLTLILERDATAGPAPTEPLLPAARPGEWNYRLPKSSEGLTPGS